MILLPYLIRAKISANHMVTLKNELEIFGTAPEFQYDDILEINFNKLNLKKMQFHYEEDDTSFCIGPITLEIEKGDVIFIYGSNGSGKTTFINCLLGLNSITLGLFTVNNMDINNNAFKYKSLFAVVFSDFYLFDELYGIDNFNFKKWQEYLKLFELEGVVTIKDNCFSTINLSTGQRKRLALISALMEEKPILVLDEWAADQDPYFRKRFYTVIIPELKKQHITVIAITHDDKYYHLADKLYKMEYGQLLNEKVEKNEFNLFSLK
jgi:putative ATP-binding cassette transporter